MFGIIIETIIAIIVGIIIETIIGIISGTMNHRTVNDRRTTYRSRRHRVNNHPPASDPTSDPTRDPTSAASETTVDREGDGRIRKGLASLGGR